MNTSVTGLTTTNIDVFTKLGDSLMLHPADVVRLAPLWSYWSSVTAGNPSRPLPDSF
jgi:hypothetical protein